MLFKFFDGLFFKIKDATLTRNPCEASRFIHNKGN